MPSLLKMMAEMGLNIQPFEAGMKKAEHLTESATHNIGHHITGLIGGYFGFHALQHAILGVAEHAVKIGELAKQFGVTTDEVQKLGIAAEHIGLDFDAVGAGLIKLGAARQAALEGNERLIYIFNRLNIGQMATDIERISDVQVFKQLGEALHGMEVNSETREFLKEILGKSGPKLMEVLQGLEHAEHAPIISKEDIDSIHQAEIAVKNLKHQWDSFASKPIGAAATFWETVLGDVNKVKGPLDKSLMFIASYLGNVLGVNPAEDKHVNNALPKPEKQKFKYLAPDGITVLREEDVEHEGSGAHGEGHPGGGQIKSPAQVTAMLKAQFDLEERKEAIVFGQATTFGKIDILHKKISDSSQAEVRLKQQLLEHVINQEEYERHIAEQKLIQLNAESQIYDLHKRQQLGAAGFRKFAAAAGLDPSAYGGASHTNSLTSAIKGLGRTSQTDAQIAEMLKRLDRHFDGRIILGR